MNLHIDSINSGRYSNSATTLLVAGRGNPELTIAHDRALAVFLCAKHCHIPIMVGRAGQPKGWPVSMVAGISTPVRLTTSRVVESLGGELSKLTIEAAIMATVPTLTHPEITIISGRAVTTSLAVATYFGKRHADVIRKIEAIECSPEFTERNFALSNHFDSTGRQLPCYEITRSGFMFLVMGFTGKKAALLKENYINAFDAMEANLTGLVPTLPETTQLLITLVNGVVVDSRPVQEGEITASIETFIELTERRGLLVIHPDDLKSLSFGNRQRGDS